MTSEPLLKIHLQAGLSTLKTLFCHENGCTKEDPLPQSTFRQLAEPLPYIKHIHSKLVCFISKEIMNKDNPPMVLPNGYVYSGKSLEEMAKKSQGKLYSAKMLGYRFPIGLEEQIEIWETEIIRAFHQRWYFPANALLFIVKEIGSVGCAVQTIEVQSGLTPPSFEPALELPILPPPKVKERHLTRPPVQHEFSLPELLA